MKDEHKHLLSIMRRFPDDYEPYGEEKDRRADCSCGCKHFYVLDGPLGGDWGVCGNPRSHRCNLLTFEHQGCLQFECDGVEVGRTSIVVECECDKCGHKWDERLSTEADRVFHVDAAKRIVEDRGCPVCDRTPPDSGAEATNT